MSLEDVRIRRVYEPPSPGDGKRVLVDRLWPRGIRRENAAIDLWLKEIAPSDALRRRLAMIRRTGTSSSPFTTPSSSPTPNRSIG